jgi:hypothetical protein
MAKLIHCPIRQRAAGSSERSSMLGGRTANRASIPARRSRLVDWRDLLLSFSRATRGLPFQPLDNQHPPFPACAMGERFSDGMGGIFFVNARSRTWFCHLVLFRRAGGCAPVALASPFRLELLSAKADSGRFDAALAPTNAVTRGLYPRVHPLRIELFTKKMACRVIRAFTDVCTMLPNLNGRR